MNKNGKAEYISIFSGRHINFSDKNFEGAEATSVFGGIDLNLRYAHIDKDVYIEAAAIFGGMTIIVPEDVNVKVNRTGIFGGVSDRVNRADNPLKKTIYIDAAGIFGGITIKE